MSKVAIVGVEGSGKTTLMASIGDAYMAPDENGYFLEAKDQATMTTVGIAVSNMREGRWPPATAHSTLTELKWTLLHRETDGAKEICDLSFLDYAGEIYRLAFGQGNSEEDLEAYKSQIDALKGHIEAADILLVLINMANVIDGDRKDPRVWQMLFITGNIIKFAAEKMKSVALLFSQADKYHPIIEQEGGIGKLYARHLPNVEARYPKLRIFAVSAVDKTVVDESGHENPARDFRPSGIGELGEWIVSEIKRMSAARKEFLGALREMAEKKTATPTSAQPRPVRQTPQPSPASVPHTVSEPTSSSESIFSDIDVSRAVQIILGLVAVVVGLCLLFNGQKWGKYLAFAGAAGLSRLAK